MSSRKNLDKATVVLAAAELLKHAGAEGLNLARLAESLGIQTPSLYNHIGGLGGLQRELNLLSLRVLTARLTSAALGVSGAQAVRQIAQAYRAYIKENTGLYLMGVRSSALLPAPDLELEQVQAHLLQVTLAALSAFGLLEVDALHYVRGLRALVHGFALLEAAGGFGLPYDCDESFSRLLEIYIESMQGQRK